jgi:hypothetical protein
VLLNSLYPTCQYIPLNSICSRLRVRHELTACTLTSLF